MSAVAITRTISVSRDELLARRATIFRELGMTRRDFEDRARDGALTGDEWYLAEDLEEIAFLLDDDSQH